LEHRKREAKGRKKKSSQGCEPERGCPQRITRMVRKEKRGSERGKGLIVRIKEIQKRVPDEEIYLERRAEKEVSQPDGRREIKKKRT